MVLHFKKEMKNDIIVFFLSIVAGFSKLYLDASVVLKNASWAAIFEGCGTALLFGACGVAGKKLGEYLIVSVSKSYKQYVKNYRYRRNVKRAEKYPK